MKEKSVSLPFPFVSLYIYPTIYPTPMAGASINLHSRAKAEGFSARFVCLTGETVKGGLHPIRLQLIHNLKVKRFSTGEACAANEWDADSGRMKPRAKTAAQVNRVLNAMEAEVVSIVDALVVHDALTFDAFEARYRNPKATADVLGYIAQLEQRYAAEGRLGTAYTFRNAASALRRLSGGRSLRFGDLTARKLEELERFLKADGCTPGGIGAYMRTIRRAVNLAIKEGHMAEDQYPFETVRNRGFSMKRLKSERNPRALADADMEKVKRFPFAKAPHLAETVRLFLFSYYARGMNFTDLAHLKRSDLSNGRITYRRRKTGDAFTIPVEGPLAELLKAFDHDGPYLLPILGSGHVTPVQQRYRIQKCLSRMNRELKEAAEVIGIKGNLTTYVARHTYADTLKRNGVDVSVISEAMGHENVSTTRAYLKRFPSEVLDRTDAFL